MRLSWVYLRFILGRQYYGVTRNVPLLFNVPPGVVTVTKPVVARRAVVLISVAETTINVAAVPSKLTLVAPDRLCLWPVQ